MRRHGIRKIQTLNPNVQTFSLWIKGDCPHCGDRIIRKDAWEYDLAIRWHDYWKHGIPMDEVAVEV